MRSRRRWIVLAALAPAPVAFALGSAWWSSCYPALYPGVAAERVALPGLAHVACRVAEGVHAASNALLLPALALAVAGGVALAVSRVVRKRRGPERAARAGAVAAWLNLAALAVSATSAALVLSSGDGELMFFGAPFVVVPLVGSWIGTAAAFRRAEPAAVTAPRS